MPEAPTEPSKNLLRKPSVSQVVVAILLGGLAFAITCRSSRATRPTTPSVRGEELVELLKSLDSANERLDTQIDDLTGDPQRPAEQHQAVRGGRAPGQGARRAAGHPRRHVRRTGPGVRAD